MELPKRRNSFTRNHDKPRMKAIPPPPQNSTNLKKTSLKQKSEKIDFFNTFSEEIPSKFLKTTSENRPVELPKIQRNTQKK